MHVVETFLGLLLLLGALTWLALKLHLPSPVLLVVAGISIAVVPGLPKLALDPDAIFLIFVPPIVYYAAFFCSWGDLLRNARAIALLAVPLVLTSIAAVAVVAHLAMPGFSWPLACVLGAIVAPSDATAVLAVLKDLRLPRRLNSVLAGESLLNDPVALVSYRVAIAAVVTGAFSPLDACQRLVWMTLGGALTGAAIGWCLYQLRARQEGPEIEVVASFLSPYAAYLPAEWLGVSGVTATLACGMVLGWKLPNVTDPETRLLTRSAWSILLFLLNGFIFLLLGMALPEVVARLAGSGMPTLGLQALFITLVVIAVRIAWIMGPPILACWRGQCHDVPPGEFAIASWSGLRGVDTLVTALAIPLVVASGAPFPLRDRIIFIAAVVILGTLGLQGLTMPILVRWFDVRADDVDERETARARLSSSQSALGVLRERAARAPEHYRVPIEQLTSEYEHQSRRFDARLKGTTDDDREAFTEAYHNLLKEALDAERATIIMLRNAGVISNDVMHRLERELDLKETLHRTD